MCSYFVAARVCCSTSSAPAFVAEHKWHLLLPPSFALFRSSCRWNLLAIGVNHRNHYASPVQKGYIYKYACICIFIIVILSNCPMLSMDSPSMCRLGSFSHMLSSGSDAEFRQCLPVVLLIHVSAISREDVYPENNREALTKFCIGSGAELMGKWTQSTHTRAVHG